MDESLQGKPARSQDAIRASLDSMRQANKTVPKAGPMIDGFRPDSPIVVGTFYDFDLAANFQNLLEKHQIFSDSSKSGRTLRVFVDADDSQESAKLFQQHRQQFPDRQPKSVSQRYDYLVFGIFAGLALSLIFLEPHKINFSKNPLTAAVPITFAIFLGLCGHLFDRFRAEYQRTGKLRLGVWEFMILITLPVIYLLTIDLIKQAIFG